MKESLALYFVLTTFLSPAQTFTGKINGYAYQSAQVVVFPFGMEYPVKIGEVDEDGHLRIHLDSVNIQAIPDSVQVLFLSDLSENFFVKCDDPTALFIPDSIRSITCQTFCFLWNGSQVTGALFPVSDEKLLPWVEDRFSNEPVKASFYQLIYSEKDVSVKNNCTTTYYLTGGNVETTNMFDIKLNKRFNLLQYTIEDIYTYPPEENSSVPKIIQIKNPVNESKIKWVLKSFL